MNTIKVVLIEDERNIRAGVSFLMETIAALELSGVAASVSDGVALIREVRPDIVLLDVRLEDGTGFDLLEQLTDVDFGVIFVTAYDEYAIRAIKYNALDYLMKPIDPSEFEEAMKKAMEHRTRYADFILEDIPTRITINTSEGKHILPFADLIRCQADGGYTLFHLEDGKRHIVSKPLKYFVDLLPEHLFLRPHQSHLINVAYVRTFTQNVLMLSEGSEIPISLRKRALVKRMFEG